ncbi:MAG: PQQ-binding-like beta-propeller repeat protein [Planctomycetota bacterium]
MRTVYRTWTWLLPLSLLFPAFCPASVAAADRPQWGQKHTRNNASSETGLSEWFDPGRRDPASGEIDPATTKNVHWVARLGTVTYATPVVAEGKVFIGTNNDQPRDERIRGDRGVLMCFDEPTGRFLWQLVVPKMHEYKNSDWLQCGVTSPPTIEDGRAYVVSNRCEVICLDVDGLADGNDGPYTDEGRHMVPTGEPPLEPGPADADIVWLYDMTDPLGVRPHNASNCSILVDGDFLYVCTSNGVEWTHTRVTTPEAPTLIVLDKNTGKLVARDDFGVGPDIIHGQWSSPALGRVGEKALLFQGAGNGFIYAFEPFEGASADAGPAVLKNVWHFNGHPRAQTQDHVAIDHRFDSTSFEVIANPVFHNGRVYVPITQDPFHGMRLGWLLCLDAAGTGDVTRSGLLWSYDKTGTSISTVAIADGLVYLADHAGRIHCLDAESGEPHWTYEAGGPIWGSTLVADGKLYVGTGRATLWVLAAGKDLKVLGRIRMRDQIFNTPVAANGTLYVATNRHLYAVRGHEKPETEN